MRQKLRAVALPSARRQTPATDCSSRSVAAVPAARTRCRHIAAAPGGPASSRRARRSSLPTMTSLIGEPLLEGADLQQAKPGRVLELHHRRLVAGEHQGIIGVDLRDLVVDVLLLVAPRALRRPCCRAPTRACRAPWRPPCAAARIRAASAAPAARPRPSRVCSTSPAPGRGSRRDRSRRSRRCNKARTPT